MDTLVKINGVPAITLGLLIEKGYFKTKAEVIRAGILNLGEKYALNLKDPKEMELNLVALKIKAQEKEMKKSGKKYLTLEEVKKKYGLK